jgi:hypothetical protein
LVVTAAALVGCGDDSEPDREEIQRELKRDVQEKTGTRDVVVSCPDDLAAGDLCDVTAPGGLKAKLRITSLDEEDVAGELVQP